MLSWLFNLFKKTEPKITKSASLDEIVKSLPDLSRQELVELEEALHHTYASLPPEIYFIGDMPFCTDPDLIVCPSPDCNELFGSQRPDAKHKDKCDYLNLKRGSVT